MTGIETCYIDILKRPLVSSALREGEEEGSSSFLTRSSYLWSPSPGGDSLVFTSLSHRVLSYLLYAMLSGLEALREYHSQLFVVGHVNPIIERGFYHSVDMNAPLSLVNCLFNKFSYYSVKVSTE